MTNDRFRVKSTKKQTKQHRAFSVELNPENSEVVVTLDANMADAVAVYLLDAKPENPAVAAFAHQLQNAYHELTEGAA
jgi:hypothetical protein